MLEEVQVPIALRLGVVHRMLATASAKIHANRQRPAAASNRLSRTYRGELTPSAFSKSCSDCIAAIASVLVIRKKKAKRGNE